MEFFENMDVTLKVFWYIAIPTSLIFLVQTVLTFIGADATDGVEADFDGDLDGSDTPFQLFSFRNMINFLLGFSWTGISFYESIINKTGLILIATAVGVVFILLFFFIMKQLQKLAEDNSFKFEEVLNKTADVYLTIPENKMGKGKIMISVRGSVRELDAMTEGTRIETGKVVKIVKIESDNILIVQTI